MSSRRPTSDVNSGLDPLVNDPLLYAEPALVEAFEEFDQTLSDVTLAANFAANEFVNSGWTLQQNSPISVDGEALVRCNQSETATVSDLTKTEGSSQLIVKPGTEPDSGILLRHVGQNRLVDVPGAPFNILDLNAGLGGSRVFTFVAKVGPTGSNSGTWNDQLAFGYGELSLTQILAATGGDSGDETNMTDEEAVFFRVGRTGELTLLLNSAASVGDGGATVLSRIYNVKAELDAATASGDPLWLTLGLRWEMGATPGDGKLWTFLRREANDRWSEVEAFTGKLPNLDQTLAFHFEMGNGDPDSGNPVTSSCARIDWLYTSLTRP